MSKPNRKEIRDLFDDIAELARGGGPCRGPRIPACLLNNKPSRDELSELYDTYHSREKERFIDLIDLVLSWIRQSLI